jgi:hypothetical protein
MSDKLFMNWLDNFVASLPQHRRIFRFRKGEPRFQTHNYFERFKVETCQLSGDGTTASNIECIVVEVSDTDETAKVVPGLQCEAVRDI